MNGQLAFKHALARFFRETGGHGDGLLLAFDGQGAHHFVLAGRGQGFDAGGFKPGFGKGGGVEPGLGGQLVIGLVVIDIDAGQIYFQHGAGFVGMRGVKAQLAAKGFEHALHAHTHLLVVKSDFAGLGLQLGVFGRLGAGGKKQADRPGKAKNTERFEFLHKKSFSK